MILLVDTSSYCHRWSDKSQISFCCQSVQILVEMLVLPASEEGVQATKNKVNILYLRLITPVHVYAAAAVG